MQLHPDDFEGKELSLKLHRDGTLGSFESSSGKIVAYVSFFFFFFLINGNKM